mmetsp:Transcript_106509/g.308216  ORF Transcript_106509/g.308216 Transcript_106509/m.308216 type:complete len:201 (+) Transcript_106509:334-936(+)
MPDDVAPHRQGLVVVGLDPMVHDVLVEHRRHEIVADAFNLIGLELLVPSPRRHLVHGCRLREDAAIWVHSDDLDARDLLLQLLGRAGDCAASARGHYHVVQLTARLLDDLLRSALVVRQWVAGVLILVENVAVQLLGQALREEDVRVLRIPCRLCGRAENLGAQTLHGVHLLAGHLLGQADDHLVAFQRRGHAQADACVA